MVEEKPMASPICTWTTPNSFAVLSLPCGPYPHLRAQFSKCYISWLAGGFCDGQIKHTVETWNKQLATAEEISSGHGDVLNIHALNPLPVGVRPWNLKHCRKYPQKTCIGYYYFVSEHQREGGRGLIATWPLLFRILLRSSHSDDWSPGLVITVCQIANGNHSHSTHMIESSCEIPCLSKQWEKGEGRRNIHWRWREVPSGTGSLQDLSVWSLMKSSGWLRDGVE